MIDSIRTYLLTQTTITDVVGQCIWLGRLPQNPGLPAITLHIISRTHGHNLDGRDGYAKARVQIDCWSPTYSQALSLTDAVGDVLDGFTGSMGAVTFGAILSDDDVGEQHFYEPPEDGSNFGLYHISTDYFCWHFE